MLSKQKIVKRGDVQGLPRTLLLPSWYPENPTDPRGSFFREQAKALVEAGLPLSVLVIRKRSLSRKRLLLAIARGSVGRIWKSDDGVPTCEWILPELVNPKWSWVESWMIRGALRWLETRTGPFDLFYAHCALDGGRRAQDLARSAGRPYLVHEHYSGYLRRRLSNVDWEATATVYEGAASVYAVSRSFASFLEEQVCKGSCSVGVLPNFLARQFETAASESKMEAAFLFVSLGRLVSLKRYDILLEAFAKTFAGTNEKLLIGGAGPEEANLRNLSRNLGIESQVEFVGPVSREKVIPFLRRGRIFVLPSEVETFGVVLIESLALGIPVVATACGGPEDIVRESNGIIVPPNDCGALADGLRQSSQWLNSWNSAAIREDSLRRFGSKAVTAQTIDACRAVVRKSKGCK